jgi:hypothetical protein
MSFNWPVIRFNARAAWPETWSNQVVAFDLGTLNSEVAALRRKSALSIRSRAPQSAAEGAIAGVITVGIDCINVEQLAPVPQCPVSGEGV